MIKNDLERAFWHMNFDTLQQVIDDYDQRLKQSRIGEHTTHEDMQRVRDLASRIYSERL